MEFRKIIHVDMDAFYASVAQRDDPSLVGKPIVVGYDGPRGVVATASYEARKYGIHSALSIQRAKQLCRDLIIVPCTFDLYKEISAQIHEIFFEYTDLVEPLSLDEAFLDVTKNKPGIELGRDIAIEIKRKIKEQTRLNASAGVSYCKFLAKVASDFRKPNGLTVIHPSVALDFIAKLKIEDFWGVGPKTAEKMHKLGIFNGAQLRAQSSAFLTRNFGKSGVIYYQFARGIDLRTVNPTRLRKSVGCEDTFQRDIYEEDDVIDELNKLIDRLQERLSRKNFVGRTITIKVKYYDFTIISRSLTRENGISADSDLYHLVQELHSMIEYSKACPIRLLGLTVSNPLDISFSETRFPSLFDGLDDEDDQDIHMEKDSILEQHIHNNILNDIQDVVPSSIHIKEDISEIDPHLRHDSHTSKEDYCNKGI